MLTRDDLQLAKDVLATYEVAYTPNATAVSDIQSHLYWCELQQAFSIDAGMLLRGDFENVRIYKGVEDYAFDRIRPLNHYDATIVFNREVYFFEGF